MQRINCKVNPDLNEAQELFLNGMTTKSLLVVIADCRVNYEGRSSSSLDWGERLIIVKADGSVLIHQPSGYEPVNWQPPSCFLYLLKGDENLTLKVIRRSPREMLTVYIRKIYIINVMKMVDTAKLEMLLSEKDLYNVISSHPDIIESGFRIVASQKEFKRGIADLTGIDREGRYTIVEVKRVTSDVSAVKQLQKYLSAIRITHPSVRGILVAPAITSEAKRLLKSLNLEFAPINLKRCASLSTGNRESTYSLDSHMD